MAENQVAQAEAPKSDLSKCFGFILFSAGILIATVYTMWVILCMVSQQTNNTTELQPIMKDFREEYMVGLIPNPLLLLQLPALALAVGVALIYLFIIKTEKAIAEKKRKQAADAKKK